MKPPKPGQYWSPDGVHIVRVAQRTNGCNGCLYEKIIPCPNSIVKGSKKEPVDCVVNDIIFVKPQ